MNLERVLLCDEIVLTLKSPSRDLGRVICEDKDKGGTDRRQLYSIIHLHLSGHVKKSYIHTCITYTSK
jgi:hypothetical protein